MAKYNTQNITKKLLKKKIIYLDKEYYKKENYYNEGYVYHHYGVHSDYILMMNDVSVLNMSEIFYGYGAFKMFEFRLSYKSDDNIYTESEDYVKDSLYVLRDLKIFDKSWYHCKLCTANGR